MKLVEFNTSLNIVQSARLWSDKDPALTHAKDLCYYQSFNLGLNSKPFFFPGRQGKGGGSLSPRRDERRSQSTGI